MELTSIHKRMTEVENYKNENKVAREALKDELENNPEYIKACEEVEATVEKRKRIKDEILAKAETQKLITEIKENKEELDTLEEILSTELMEYHIETKADEIEDADGEKRQFKIIAKLLPKKKKWEDRDIDGRYSSKIEPELPNFPTNGVPTEKPLEESPEK